MHLGSGRGRAWPARLTAAQPTWLVAQHDGNREQRSATAVLAAVGDSGMPAPEVVGEQALRQGGGVVDRFEARKRSEGAHQSYPRWHLRLMGKWQRMHEPRVEGAGDWFAELRGAAPELGDGSDGRSEGPGRHCMVVPQRWHGGTVGVEEGERILHVGRAPFLAGRGGGRRAARR
jgi:hypothetical protein